MRKSRLLGGLVLCAAMAMSATQPAAADSKTTNTILGAGVGAAAGAVLSQGDTLTTLGGAAAGGLLGNLLTEEPRKHHRHARPHKHHHPHFNHRGKPRHVHYSGKGKWKHGGPPKHRGHGRHHHR